VAEGHAASVLHHAAPQVQRDEALRLEAQRGA
jgi:hypothetical protein